MPLCTRRYLSLRSCGLRFRADIHPGGEHAYYHRRVDEIHLPPRKAFPDRGAYCATALHELVHWTGHETRCNRDLKGGFGDLAYAAGELIAELGSAFLRAHRRVDGSLQHSAYVRAWLPSLKQDKRGIFAAVAKAQAPADFVVGASQATDTQEVAA